jgi:hypothetical protein
MARSRLEFLGSESSPNELPSVISSMFFTNSRPWAGGFLRFWPMMNGLSFFGFPFEICMT